MIEEADIERAMRHVLSGMQFEHVTIAQTIDAVAKEIGVDESSLRERHYGFIAKTTPMLLSLCIGSPHSDGSHRKRATFKFNSAVTPSRKRSRTSIDDDRESITSRWTHCTPSSKSRKKKKSATTPESTITPRCSSKTQACPRDQEPKRLTEMAHAVGLMSPRSVLRKQLNKAHTPSKRSELLHQALVDKNVNFSGCYPTKQEIAVARTRYELLQDLDGIDESNVLANVKRSRTTRRDTIRQLFFDDIDDDDDPHAHLTMDEEEEKEDASDVSFSSIDSDSVSDHD